MTTCPARHFQAHDGAMLVRRALVPKTGTATMHPTDYLLSVAINAAAGVVAMSGRTFVDVVGLSNCRQTLNVCASAIAYDPSHPRTNVLVRFGSAEHAEVWEQATKLVDDVLGAVPPHPTLDDPNDIALMRHRLVIGYCIASDLCDAIGAGLLRHTSDDDLDALLEHVTERLEVGDGIVPAVQSALAAVQAPE